MLYLLEVIVLAAKKMGIRDGLSFFSLQFCDLFAIDGNQAPVGSNLSTYLPVVTERIDNAADTPAMTFDNCVDHFSASSAGSRKRGVRGGISEENAETRSFQGLWTEISMFRRFIAHPELRIADGEPRDDTFPSLVPICLNGTKCVLIELDGSAAVSDKQPWSGRALDI